MGNSDEYEVPTSIAQYVYRTETIEKVGHRLFKIQLVPGKGRGIVARSNIDNGRRIICEKPLFTTPYMSRLNGLESNIAEKLKALSKTQQRQFFSLHNSFPGKNPFSGIVKTNAFPCGLGSPIGGIYPTISLINHSCLPNAHHSWNSATHCETIHAIRCIEPGEEITIAYDRTGPSKSRQAFLKDEFGFDCNCTLCSLPLSDLQISDARRVQIHDLDCAIGDPERVLNKPDDCLADCYLLHQIVKDEYKGNVGVLDARLYYDAFQISITHGDQARASVFAERGYQSRVMCEGEDSPETIRMKRLKDDPTQDMSFGVSRRWYTPKRMVPKSLDDSEYENWLWRRGR